MQPIHTAASSGQLKVMAELIQKFGVDPREKSDVCVTSLPYLLAIYINLCNLILGRSTAITSCCRCW